MERAGILGDVVDAELAQHPDRGGHAVEVLKRQGYHLESAGVRPKRRVVLGEAGEIVGPLEGHPTRDGGLES